MQDGARRGAIETGAPPDEQAGGARNSPRRESDAARAHKHRGHDPAFLQAIGALALGVVLLALLIRWISG